MQLILTNVDRCKETTVSILNTTLRSTNMTLPKLIDFSTYQLTIQAMAVDSNNTNVFHGEVYSIEFTTKESGKEKLKLLCWRIGITLICAHLLFALLIFLR